MSKKLHKISIIAMLVSVIGGSLTFLMTWRNLGFGPSFVTSWLSSFLLCILCIAPIGGLLSLFVHRTVNALLPNLSHIQNGLVFGVCMALLMESIMAVVTTVNLYGFIEFGHFIEFWSTALVTALPVGLFFSVLMSLVIKPRLMAFWAS